MYKSKYRQQKRNAQDRGIEFYFTYKEWCSWWEKHLGPDWHTLRGCKKGQYVMARRKDEGVYEASNVRCITSGENRQEAIKYGDNNARLLKARASIGPRKSKYDAR